jgi:hypothetical protein
MGRRVVRRRQDGGRGNQALRAAAVVDDLVRWSQETLVRPLAFICNEGDFDVILRRIEAWAHTNRPRR